jgi:hypothetical protein
MNETKQQSCEGKYYYHNEFHAKRELRKMIDLGMRTKWELRPYKCKHCEFWHLGHADKETQALVRMVLHKRPQPPLIRLKKKA